MIGIKLPVRHQITCCHLEVEPMIVGLSTYLKTKFFFKHCKFRQMIEEMVNGDLDWY